MKRLPDTFERHLGIALLSIQLVERFLADKEWRDAAFYARETRAYLDRAERAARREAGATLKPLRVRSTKGLSAEAPRGGAKEDAA